MRKVCYVSGTRADYGLMRRTLATLAAEPGMALSVAATGMHLDPAYGDTIAEIEADGHPVIARIAVPFDADDGGQMARNLGAMTMGLTDAFAAERPDLVLLLGDRAEMLAGAIAAIHLGIPVAHVHGGERSGTVDEAVRHAVTKLAHIHLPATAASAERIERMGEDPAHIHTVGAPGLDGLLCDNLPSRDAVAAEYGFDPSRPFALLLFHPEAHDARAGADQIAMVLTALEKAGVQVLALMPNSDAGASGIRGELEARGDAPLRALRTHLPRDRFVEVMARVDIMIGNSSAGIIEAASFGTPVINLGDRQALRERNANVRDVPLERAAVARAIGGALASGRLELANVYGDGATAPRIAAILRDYPLDRELLAKVNRY